MKNRKWTGQQKLQIVIEGLKQKKPIAQLCTEHGIGQTQYYKWKDQFLKHGPSIFEHKADRKVDLLKAENRQLKQMIGELTVELKKTEIELEWLES